MADNDEVITPLGTLTTNYGWTKPTVGGDVDAWGGLINTDLDAIDTTVKSVSTVANAAYPATNPSGYQTAVQVTAALPVASSTTPLMDGVAAVGTGTTWARADHVHPISAINDNRIINGDMRIDQRNNGASGTATNVYTVDRWQYLATQAAKGTWGRITSNMPGFPYCLTVNSSSAYTPLAADYFAFRQPIEADQISDFQWGTSNAQPVTLSFWVSCSLTGTFSGCISNFAGTRAYPFIFTIPTANTNTRIVVTIPGDTSGTWVMSGNAGGALVYFDLGCGSTNRGPASAWASASYMGVTGAVSLVATNGANFYLTGVKLEIGSVATPYNRQSLAKSMADCQRYYRALTVFASTAYALTANVFWVSFTTQTMRATPTATLATGGAANCTTFAVVPFNMDSFYVSGQATAAGGAYFNASVTLSAEL